MDQKQLMLRGIEQLSETERLELFNVEELETRLEMAALSAMDATNGSCGTTVSTTVTTTVSGGGCW